MFCSFYAYDFAQILLHICMNIKCLFLHKYSYRKSRSKVYTLTLSALRWVTTQLDLTVLQFISVVFKLYNATKNLIGVFFISPPTFSWNVSKIEQI